MQAGKAQPANTPEQARCQAREQIAAMSLVALYRPAIEAQQGREAVHPSFMFTNVIESPTSVIVKSDTPLIGRGINLSPTPLNRSGGKPDESSERISDAEHAVMEALWDHGDPASAQEVFDQIGTARDWSLATVKTLLSRLVQKQAIATRPDGRRFLYSPLIARSDYVGGESRRLVDKLFGGRAASLVAHLAQSEALSEADLSEIEALLKELKQ